MIESLTLAEQEAVTEFKAARISDGALKLILDHKNARIADLERESRTACSRGAMLGVVLSVAAVLIFFNGPW